MAHQKPPIVIHGYRGVLIIRFDMRALQAASEDLFPAFLAQLAPERSEDFDLPSGSPNKA